jgi:hypothetical protein
MNSPDITTIDPTHLLVYSITGYGNSGDALFIPGAGTTAAQQTIADANSLFQGTEMLNQVTQAYTGTPSDDTPGEDTPQSNTQYSKWAITNKMAAIANDMQKETDPTKVQMFQARLNAWSNMNSLNDTQLQIPSGEMTNMNKALESNVQQDQSNLQSVNSLGSTAVGNKTYASNLIQQVY